MPKRSHMPTDMNQLAAAIVAKATSEEDEADVDPYQGKDPAAVELGRKGGLKGGRARAAKMTAEERSAVAKKAVAARWAKRGED